MQSAPEPGTKDHGAALNPAPLVMWRPSSAPFAPLRPHHFSSWQPVQIQPSDSQTRARRVGTDVHVKSRAGCGSPWEIGYCENFNSKMRDEFPNGENFYSLQEARVLTKLWRIYYNTERPHSSLRYRRPHLQLGRQKPTKSMEK